ncbi:helix-turn-helix transcriptional regulator [Bacillus xiapuensis]|uniref:Helix-turn-helix transcriptional regulator n=1 Tax=Bacillus xiapuensis TaxID=2014075 RepID=A0ABU6N7Y6_9BACI|nr:helix-turn-helix transcriptional regulator [Bacillus xiapuensis]
MEVLAKRLKWLREKERYAQKDIAKKIGMTPSGYQKIEYGERDPKLDVLVSLCDIFDVSADFLLGRNNDTKILKELARDIYVHEVELDVLRSEHTNLTIRQYDLQAQIEEIKNASETETKGIKRDNNIRGNLEERERMLHSIIDRKIDVEAEMYAHKKELGIALEKYIHDLLELPESIPSEDKKLKGYLPISMEIQPDIFDHYSLHLSVNGVGFIGHYGNYETIEETEKEKERLLKLLNGNQK